MQYRRFRRQELRFEVIFETPVIFMAPPTNTKGPIPEKPIYYINGSRKSYEETWTTERTAEKEQTIEAIKRVHTADDERASWVTILSSLQLLESDSRKWEEKTRKTPRGKTYAEPEYTMSVGIQRKTRSWDFMVSTFPIGNEEQQPKPRRKKLSNTDVGEQHSQ